ncbi:MAG: TRAP transporter large permease subunit [Opitutaceae bacterium]|nr:TRAP transporter large permease subunit [Opitutaceae bacterium]
MTAACEHPAFAPNLSVPASASPWPRAMKVRRWFATGENIVLATLLAAMVALPLVEIALRQFSSGIPSAPEFLRHLTLWVGMLGGAIAARDKRLLALATAHHLPSGRLATFAHRLATAAATAVSAMLAVASSRFVLEERAGGAALAYGIPLWVVQLALPLGFATIAVRIAWQSDKAWRRRATTVVLAALLVIGATYLPTGFALAALVLAMACGAPIFVALGGAALILFTGHDVPITAVAIDHYGLVTNPALPAIPLFTLAGYFMAEGGASRRLVRVFQALTGWMRGGPAIATALICAFFTAFTGGSGVTILALGGLLMPVLAAARFSDRDALGLLTGAGSLGILLPPCLPVILYAIIAKVDINTMFLGGLLPGLLLIALTAAWGVWAGRRNTSSVPAFDFAEARAAVIDAEWEMLLPVVSLAALFSGWATPVEAAAVTAAYAFVIEVVIHRDLRLGRDCPRVMAEAGVLVGGILLILGVALGLTNYLIDAQVPDAFATWSLENIKSPWLFLLGLNVVLIVVGSVVEIFAAIVVVVPLLIPVGLRLGIDPVHLGIIFLANMELGFLAPPIGLNLLLASSRLHRPVTEVARATLPLLGVMFIGVLLITYFPPLTTWLPQLFSRSTP